jgi:hypothetical protein
VATQLVGKCGSCGNSGLVLACSQIRRSHLPHHINSEPSIRCLSWLATRSAAAAPRSFVRSMLPKRSLTPKRFVELARQIEESLPLQPPHLQNKTTGFSWELLTRLPFLT